MLQAASTSPLGVEWSNHRHNFVFLPDLLGDDAGLDLSLILPSLHCASPHFLILTGILHHIANTLYCCSR